MTLANDLKTAYVNNASWEDMEKLSRERFMDELFDAAADLFDPNTTLNVDTDEYHRGVTELVARITGSDDKDDVASIISERTATGHMVTAADFTRVGDSMLYIGPFAEAVRFIRDNCDVDKDAVRNIQTGLYTVELDGGNVWGHGDTPELAWRYAMGAEFRSLEGDFEPFRLTVK